MQNGSPSSSSPQGFDFATPFASHELPKAESNQGFKCELKRFDSLFNTKGERYILRAGSKVDLGPAQRDNAYEYALVLTKYWSKDKEEEYSELEIRSPHMKAALKAAVPQYRDFNVDVKHIIIRDEPQCIFHFRRELQEFGRNLKNAVAAKHLLFLLKYMYGVLTPEIRTYYSFVEGPTTPPSIDFLNLWMIFRPGDLFYVKINHSDEVSRGRVMKFESMSRCKCKIPWCTNSRWAICGLNIDYDGSDFGHTNNCALIKPYEGYHSIRDLAVVPLQYHPDHLAIRESLIARGQKFTRLHGNHYRQYKGVAEVLGGTRDVTFAGEEDEFPLQSTHINSRVMIDGKAFVEARPSHTPYLSSTKKVFRTATQDHLRMEDDEYIICHNQLPGFALHEKKWAFFDVDLVKEVEFNVDAWSSLLMNEHQKRMILSLVQVHQDERLEFDDVIKGKGKGMIFLLHGEPGVGKTLTAESVADSCEKPLIRIDAGDLGTSTESVEKKMSDIFTLATKWHAILLLDEADVFLEQRQISDMKRNSLVSVFLRILEYYEGILFLTTNRIGTFDRAFKSRIHLAIHYPKLSEESRRSLWHSFLVRASPESAADLIYSGDLDIFAQEDLNGRQIRNVVRTAHALAVSEGTMVAVEHVQMALEAMKTFEADFDIGSAEAQRELRDNGGSEIGSLGAKRRRIG